jgi:hypothetical protein
MLDRGWGYDPYVQRLIGRIRQGGQRRNVCLIQQPVLAAGGTPTSSVAIKKREISAEMAVYRAEKRRKAG